MCVCPGSHCILVVVEDSPHCATLAVGSSRQVEQTELMHHLQSCLMQSNDTLSDEVKEDLMFQVRNLTIINNDLFIGNGVLGVVSLSAAEVRKLARVSITQHSAQHHSR